MHSPLAEGAAVMHPTDLEVAGPGFVPGDAFHGHLAAQWGDRLGLTTWP